jgi:DNA primase
MQFFDNLMIDQATIERIFDAAQINEVVGDFVSLRRRGVNYLGVCPFHHEKTPSFTVSPAKGIYKCFGCGKGGNSVNFIMEHENLSYVEALRYLAKKYGIEIKEKELTSEEREQQNERESLMLISEWASTFFADKLKNDREGQAIGMTYFRERGFRDDIIEKFQLGYSPQSRNALTTTAQKEGYKLDFLVKTGLTIQREDGQVFDRFSGRVMFPIHGLSGKVIGFGGRVLKTDKNTAKYLNSPESEIYHKSKVLYGIFQARKAIMQADRCYLVEGYTDVISMHQSGIENVAASSGTSLTTEQIRLIKRFTQNITILYDGDSAGIKASLRGIDMVLEEGLNVKVMLLPDGEDPDSFARSHSATEVVDFITAHETDFVLFKTKLLLEDAQNDPIKRAALINEIVKSIAIIPDTITRSVYIRECSSILKIDEQVLYTETAKIHRQKKGIPEEKSIPNEIPQQPEVSPVIVAKRLPTEMQEREIIRLLIKYGTQSVMAETDQEGIESQVSLAEYIISDIESDELEFEHPFYAQIYNDFKIRYVKGEIPDSNFFTRYPDEKIVSLVVDLLAEPYVLSKIWTKSDIYIETEEQKLRRTANEAVRFFKKRKLVSQKQQLQIEILTAQEQKDEEKIAKLQEQLILNDRILNIITGDNVTV